MTNRTEWKFPAQGSALVGPARKCLDHHTERLAFWTAELDKATAELREKGITIRELPESYALGGTMSYRGDQSVEINEHISTRIRECKTRGQVHQQQRDEFDRWVRAFEAHPNATYELDIDDMNFFRI